MSVLVNILVFLSLNGLMIFDFSSKSDLNDWLVVNDDVMGGRSVADLRLTEERTGLFEGKVSLENNGGFSTILLPL